MFWKKRLKSFQFEKVYKKLKRLKKKIKKSETSFEQKKEQLES